MDCAVIGKPLDHVCMAELHVITKPVLDLALIRAPEPDWIGFFGIPRELRAGARCHPHTRAILAQSYRRH